MRDLVQEAGRVPQTQTTRQGRKPLSMSQLKWADTTDTGLCSVREFNAICSAKDKEKGTKSKCHECNVGLCATPYFEVCKTKLHF